MPRTFAAAQVLYSIANPKLYHDNPFRLLGVHVEALSRQISQRVSELEMLATFETPEAPRSVMIRQVPATPDEIRNAARRLRNPEKRIIDELFWFWPEEIGGPGDDAALEALNRGDEEKAVDLWTTRERDSSRASVARHNLAVVYHVAALEWENYAERNPLTELQRKDLERAWTEAISRWPKVSEDDGLWARIRYRIYQLSDQQVTTEFVDETRNELLDALALINAQLALRYASSGNFDVSQFYIRSAHEIQRNDRRFSRVAERVIAPLNGRLREHLTRTKDRVAKDAPGTLSALRELLGHTKNVLESTRLFFSEAKLPNRDLLEEVAVECNRLKPYFDATQDNRGCLEIVEAALSLAYSQEAREQISRTIKTLVSNIESERFKPLIDLLTQIEELKTHPRSKLETFIRDAKPKLAAAMSDEGAEQNESLWEVFNLAAIVLRNIALAAWNNHKDLTTAQSASELAARYAYKPELKASLAGDQKTLAGIASQKRQKIIKWAVIGGGLLLLWIIGALNSNNSTSSTNSFQPTTSSSYAAPSYSSQSASTVPSYRATMLRQKLQAIESERASATALKNQLDTVARQIERERSSVDNTDAYSIARFNEKVDRYNTLLSQARAQQARLNSMIDDYNSQLK